MGDILGLRGKTAVITGAAGGLGGAFAHALARAGADLALIDMALRLRELEAFAERISGEHAVSCRAFSCDISRKDDADGVMRAVHDTFGRIDALINNAGIYANLAMTPFYEISPEEWDRVFAVNARGTFLMCSAAAPYMIAQKSGSIINISSASIHEGLPLMSHYVGSKGAVWAMSRTMARDVGEYNIRVNTITPGYALTDASKSLAADPADFYRNYNRNIESRALHRGMLAEDVAGAVLFLCSDLSEFITGQNLNVDGGGIHY